MSRVWLFLYLLLNDPGLKKTIKRSRRRLKTALKVAAEFAVEAKPIIRIDDDVVNGITHTAREQNASLVVMGWSDTNRLRSRLFGNIVDSVFWASHCPVAVMRLLKEPIDIHQILVPVKNISPQSFSIIRFAQLFAETNQASITLLHVSNRSSTESAIINQANDYDLVVLRSVRRRTAGGLAVSDVTHRAIKDLQCSVVLFGEPISLNV